MRNDLLMAAVLFAVVG